MMDRAETLGRMGVAFTPAQLVTLLGAPVALALVSWVYLGMMIGDMTVIPGMAAMMMPGQIFLPAPLFGLFLMWVVMMAAMMLPTAMPMMIAYARMQAADRGRGVGWMPVMMFSGGYVMAWAAFSLVAALLQAGLTHLALMSPMMMKAASAPLAGAILLLAGLYQFTPLKQTCLTLCHTPLSFLMTQWRNGNRGALEMGWRHGLFCIGCCWALMGLLFVTGVMNTLWIIAIMLYVLIEKILPGAEIISKLTGLIMIATGVWLIAA
jgi:predicted metal-binding membrane protein